MKFINASEFNIKFTGIKFIHNVVQLSSLTIPGNFSSSQAETVLIQQPLSIPFTSPHPFTFRV